MAYTVNNTAGSVLTTIADGTIDTTTDLTLIGKNYAGYGEFLNENLVKMLENFANGSAPGSPVAGQMWWDSANSLLKVYTGTAFKTVSSSTASASQPATAVTGDLWWDITNGQLKTYNGSSWVTIGPAFTAASGVSGSIVETVSDGSVNHVVVFLYAGGTRVGSISKDAEFTPNPSITGFGSIKPGVQLATNVSNSKFQGTATDSDALGGVSSANFLRSDSSDSTTGVLSVLNDTGLVVGADSDFTVGVSGSDVSVTNTTNNGDMYLKVNDGGVVTTALTIDGATARVLLAGDPTAALGAATKQYVDASTSTVGDLLFRDGTNTITGDILPDNNNQRDLGAAGTAFAEIHATNFIGTASAAEYADVAERFSADAVYEAGTIVALGGAEEITRVNDELSDAVFGVVSTQPAYLMNNKLKDGTPIAVAGRVPVKVVGMVNKGDRLVSAGNGLARAASAGEATSFNVIGRAIQEKTSSDEGIVEAFVTIN